MAIVANTFTTFEAKGQREQLADRIYDISPMDTPIVSSADKKKWKGTLQEWQTDILGAVDTGNAHLEGDDITSFPAITPTVRVGNQAQISRKLLLISGSEEEVEKAGRKSELARQVARRGMEMKRDMEGIVTANLGGDAGSTTTPRQTATLGAWIKTNVATVGSGGGNPTYTSGVPTAPRTDGTPRALTETLFFEAVEDGWTNGANINAWTAYAGPKNKQVISSFEGVVPSTYNLNSPNPVPTAVIASVDVIVSEFGKINIVPNRFQRDRDVWFLDPEYLAIGHLRAFRVEKLAKTGDAEKRMLLQEWGLEVLNEAAHGLVPDNTTP